MTDVVPLDTLIDNSEGQRVPLPADLARIYGELRLPRYPGRPTVIANFVATLDGVVALGGTGPTGGRDISGSSPQDRVVMGLLRAVADTIVVGASTLRASPRHRWTPESVYPGLEHDYGAIRSVLRKTPTPNVVVVSASGDLPLDLPLFRVAENRAIIVTTPRGAETLHPRMTSGGPTVRAISGSEPISATTILEAASVPSGGIVLVEGGPRLFGRFLADRCLDELFLTLAPQVAGRGAKAGRLGLVEGQSFAPDDPRWGRLLSVKCAGSHLFLRYNFGVDS